MPKPRSKKHQGLPARWRHLHGAYYYSVPPGLESMWDGKKLFRLGDKLHEASQVWAHRMAAGQAGGATSDVKTLGDLLDRYAREVIPSKAPASQASNRNQLPMLRKVFGHMPLAPFSPSLVYKFVDERSRKKTDPETGRVTGGKIAAHREIELLSHAFTKAIEWGYIDRHPFLGQVRLNGERPRTRLVKDWEIDEVLGLKSERKKGSILMIQAYLRLKLLTGMAQGDLLRLRIDVNLTEDGIYNERHKIAAIAGKATIYEWTPDLRDAVEMAKRARPKSDSPYLFCNAMGQGYVNEALGRASGWKSMWQRFMVRVLAETKVTERFTEHDIRAKVASDAPDLEHARKLLAHTDVRTTRHSYKRNAERVVPLEKKF
jgi:integrase